MIANGSGGQLNWQQAYKLLEAAAPKDFIAQGQLALLVRMELDSAGYPKSALPQAQLLYDNPRIVRFNSALSSEECDYIADTAAQWLAPSVVVDPRTGRTIPHPVRSSDNASVGPVHEDLVFGAINRRAAALSGTGYDWGEPLAVLRYRPGQQYRLHSDTLPNTNNQRTKTVIAYLNDDFVGGVTEFPGIGLRVTPRKGDILLFDNLDAAGCPDPKSRHAGLPVTNGAKWIATRWIRANRYDPWAGG
jgi:prolyl 4-hydroxylase